MAGVESNLDMQRKEGGCIFFLRGFLCRVEIKTLLERYCPMKKTFKQVSICIVFTNKTPTPT
jgi:hypothetical protein